MNFWIITLHTAVQKFALKSKVQVQSKFDKELFIRDGKMARMFHVYLNSFF